MSAKNIDLTTRDSFSQKSEFETLTKDSLLNIFEYINLPSLFNVNQCSKPLYDLTNCMIINLNHCLQIADEDEAFTIGEHKKFLKSFIKAVSVAKENLKIDSVNCLYLPTIKKDINKIKCQNFLTVWNRIIKNNTCFFFHITRIPDVFNENVSDKKTLENDIMEFVFEDWNNSKQFNRLDDGLRNPFIKSFFIDYHIPDRIKNISNSDILDSEMSKWILNHQNIFMDESSLLLSDCELLFLPHSLRLFKDIKIIFLDYNNVQPMAFEALSEFEHINLLSNNLSHIPKIIETFNNLKSMQILFNDNLTSLPEGIGNIKNLNRLNVDKNGLTSLPINILNSKIETLTVSGNRLNNFFKSHPDIYKKLKEKGDDIDSQKDEA